MRVKRFLSVLLSMLMVCSIFGGLSVSAYSNDFESDNTSNKIYFEKPNWYGTTFYCHIFEADTGTAFWGWQLKKERLEEDSYGNLYYDLDKLNESTQLPGGLKKGTKYYIMFSDNTGNETCSIMFNTDCIGDTVRVTDNEKSFENAVDSTKHSYPIAWEKNSDKFGIPLQITSVGTVQGEFISKGTKPEDIINQWDMDYRMYPNKSSYSPQSSARDHQTRLNEIKEEFKYMASEGRILIAGGGIYKENNAQYDETNISYLEIENEPYKTTYFLGEEFDSTGLVVGAVDLYGNVNYLDESDYYLVGDDDLSLGVNTIYVFYNNLKTSFNVYVYSKDDVVQGGKIYFEEPNWYGTTFYCHIFEADTGTAFWGWQLKKERLEEDSYGNLYYDLDKLNESTQLPGGLKKGTKYYIMFSDNTGNETCSIMFNTDCIGDTVRVTDNEKSFENAVDSTKHSYPIAWEKNSDKFGIPLQITSVGTVQGEFIDKGISPYSIIDRWNMDYTEYPNKSSYSPQSSARDHQTRLEELKKEFRTLVKNGKILYVGGGTYTDEYIKIQVKTMPSAHYYEGDNFDPKGLEIVAIDVNGNEILIDPSEYTLSGGEDLSLGNNIIEVKYNKLSTSFIIKAFEKNIIGIKLSPPFKILYNEGEKLDLRGLEVTAYYEDGTTGLVKDYKISGYNSSVGKKYVKVNCRGNISYFTVEVIKRKQSSTSKTTVNLSKTSATLYVKGTMNIKPIVKNGKGKTTFKSSNPKVAKIDSKGKVTGLKVGKARITVTNNKVSKNFNVIVKNPKLNKTRLTLKVKNSYILKITGKIGKAVFTSANKKIITVNSLGKVIAKKKGKTTVIVKTNGVTLKCNIVVK